MKTKEQLKEMATRLKQLNTINDGKVISKLKNVYDIEDFEFLDNNSFKFSISRKVMNRETKQEETRVISKFLDIATLVEYTHAKDELDLLNKLNKYSILIIEQEYNSEERKYKDISIDFE